MKFFSFNSLFFNFKLLVILIISLIFLDFIFLHYISYILLKNLRIGEILEIYLLIR